MKITNNKSILIIFFVMIFIISCQSESSKDFRKIISYEHKLLNDMGYADIIPGRYQSDDGDLKIEVTEGMILFDLQVVSKAGRTGELKGEIEQQRNNIGVYYNESQDCLIQFKFQKNSIVLTQEGFCEMGLGVSATGIYKSIIERNSASVIGQIGDELGSLFYAEDEKTYKTYCHPGMEEESGDIVCKARLKSGKDSGSIVHLFQGKYNGPDGLLPPLNAAKKFKIYLTR